MTELTKEDGKYPFQNFLTAFVSCVNPRSFQGLHGESDNALTDIQVGRLEIIIRRDQIIELNLPETLVLSRFEIMKLKVGIYVT